MALVVADRVQETTTTTGTGTYTLAGAKAGFQSFAAIGDGNTCYYAITDGTDWETGIGTFTLSGTTLARTTIIESSNSDAAVNWGAGSKDIFVTAPADKTLLVGRNLYADNPSSPTAPSATGTNAIAIGSQATSTNTDAFAAGRSADATGSASVSIGYSSTASALRSLAIGSGTDATSSYASAIGTNSGNNGSQAVTGAGAMALGGSYASGTDSFAAAIANNSSSYGATGSNSIAMGLQAKATGLGAVAMGYNGPTASGTVSFATQRGQATGNGSIAMGHFNSYGFPTASGHSSIVIGDGNTGSGLRSVVLGNDSTSSHTDAIVIGGGASSSAADQITLGHTDQTVRISSSYTLPTSDGTNGQVLTTDGAGAVTFADAGGNLELYAENPSSPTAPSAGGDNSVAIGFNASTSSGSTGAHSIAIGYDAFARNQFNVAIGYDAEAGNSINTGNYAAAFGNEALAYATRSVALGKSRTGGADSFAAAIANNTSSYGATGANSVAIGYNARATGQGTLAIGGYFSPALATQINAVAISGTASGSYAAAIGPYTTASGQYSATLGYNNSATAARSVAVGPEAKSDKIGKIAFGNGSFSSNGDSQCALTTLRSDTTDATPEALTTNNSTAGTTNQIILPNNSAYSFSGTIIARQQAAGGSDYASWEIKGALLRDANAASTVLGNGIVNKLYATSGASAWAVALSADTTNGGLKVEVTGAAATNIRWVATVNTSEVTYA